jgi:hypothetical protein
MSSSIKQYTGRIREGSYPSQKSAPILASSCAEISAKPNDAEINGKDSGGATEYPPTRGNL